jgi:hypothetical protein
VLARAQAAAAEKLALGLQTGAYEATRFKSKPPQGHLAGAALLGLGAGPELDAAIARGAGLAKGITLAKWVLLCLGKVRLILTFGQCTDQRPAGQRGLTIFANPHEGRTHVALVPI